jgi:hypothetical protein
MGHPVLIPLNLGFVAEGQVDEGFLFEGVGLGGAGGW